MTGLLKLAERLETKASAIDDDSNALAITIADVILTDLVNVTPVDESTALSNWQLSLNTPVAAPIGPYFRGDRGSTQELSILEALANARLVLAKKKPGDTIYISNLLPYIRKLNEGSSMQAPAGFVERAVMLGRKVSKDFKGSIKL